jgi:hypothetical protein
VSSGCGAKLSKTYPGKRAPGRTPAHRAIMAHSAAPSLGVGIQSEKRGQSVLFNDEQLTMAEKRCSRKGGRRSEHSCFRKLVATARKERFGAKPGSAVCGEAAPEYELLLSHSTVFRMRRETLRFFLQLGRPPDLGGISERFCGTSGAVTFETLAEFKAPSPPYCVMST